MRHRRRRPFLRRRFLRTFRRSPSHPAQLNSRVRRALQHAHQLMDEEKFEQAGHAFFAIANKAENRGIPHAASLFLQAGRAWTKAEHIEKGVESLLKGLSLFAVHGLYPRLQRLGDRTVQELKMLGLNQESDKVQSHINTLLEGVDLKRWSQPPSKAPTLPAKCPFCGGNVDPREVEWVSQVGAMCEYCGSVIEASGTI